ncbi:MAG: MFS transporter [Caldilineales bacterium]
MIQRIGDSVGANRVVVALSVARFGDAVGNSILFVVIPLYVAKLQSPLFNLPETVLVGLLISVYGLVTSVMQPVMGGLVDRIGRRKLMIEIGLGLMAVSTLAFVVATRYSQLIMVRGLQGIGVAMTIPASLALMTSGTEKRTRGGSMGIYSTMRMAGFAIGPLVGGYLIDHVGFNSAFFAGAVAIVLGLVAVQVWVKDQGPRPVESSGQRFQLFDRDLLTIGILGLSFATFVMAAAFSMMTALESQFNQRLQQTTLAFGIAFSALMVSRLIFQIPLGRLSDRIGRKPLIVAGLVLMAPATMLLGVVMTSMQLTGLRLFQGLASAAIAAPTFALAADLSRAGGEGRQLSIVTMGFGLGIAVGPLIAGVLAVVSFELPFVIGGVLALLGAWIVGHYVPESVHRNRQSGDEKEWRGKTSPAHHR